MAWICRAFGSWKVHRADERVDLSGVSWLIASGVLARRSSARDVGRLTSSRVRMDRMHATSCSNSEACPCAASANIAASAKVRTVSRMRSSATSMSKGSFSVPVPPIEAM